MLKKLGLLIALAGTLGGCYDGYGYGYGGGYGYGYGGGYAYAPRPHRCGWHRGWHRW